MGEAESGSEQKKGHGRAGVTRSLDAIFFDIDDTLFSTSVFADKARRAAIDAMIKHGLRAERESCRRELEEVLGEFSSNYDRHFDKLLLRLPAEATAGLNPAILVAAGVVAYHETKWREFQVHDDAYDVLRWVAGKVPIVGIISAGWTVKQAEKIIRLKIHDFITPSAIFLTDQIGISKPNPKLYRRVLTDLDLEASRVMYVGDNPTHDIDPCKQEGFIATRIKRSGRHAIAEGVTDPDFEIHDFYELKEILRSEFGID